MRLTGTLLVLFLMLSCSGPKTFLNKEAKNRKATPPAEEKIIYKIFLIGDAGAPSLDVQEPTLKLFQSSLANAGKNSTAVFLGDNIYLNGLPDSTHPRRAFYEARINEQLKTVKDYPGRVVFIPGNHDWDDGGKDGLNAVRRQEQYIEKYLGRGNTFLPDDGFPGPVDLELMDDDEHPKLRRDIRLVVLDTQWWLHKYDKSYGDTGEYDLVDGGDFLIELEDILKKREKDFLVVAAHHPLITKGPHGGYVKPSTHLKPPIFGSLYAFYRKAFGFEQDVPHYKYKAMSTNLQNMFLLNDNLIYASGHSHSLQYIKKERNRRAQHYIVSGAGSKQNYVAKGRGAEFTHEGKGFVTLSYYENGSVWMEAWEPVQDGSTGNLLYRTELKPPYDNTFQTEQEELIDIDYSDSTVVMAPNKSYDGKSKIFEFVAGAHNRDLWSIESEYPVFDITEIRGGLEFVRMGGAAQSTNIHLEDKTGKEFVLRSVDKQARKKWDENLRKTVFLDFAQDQFSIMNPFAAVVIPKLADAVGVYHANPKIYYVPKDPQLGLYAELIGGQLALFEEKPDGDMRDVESVGKSKEVLAYRDMIRKVNGDIDHRVDQEMFARARLLDMLIADWDRHGDQWRWATFEPEDKQGKIYRPIPRDRDVAFMKMDGVGPTITKWGSLYRYQNFGENYGFLLGLNDNSLSITRRFTNQLTKQEWLAIATEMQTSLTNEIIEAAVREYPKEVFEKVGGETIKNLKIRRDKLVKVSEKNYSMISKVISVPGSNKRERFEVEALNRTSTRVRVYKLSGKGKLREQYFDRIFLKKETQEIRLYGMGGDDEFVFKGDQKSPIKLLVSGGSGNDMYKDESRADVVSKQIDIFETVNGNEYLVSSKAQVHKTKNPIDNHYNYSKDFNWDRYYPGYFFSYNNDDGLFIGGGPKILRYGFRKFPAAYHYLRVNYAPTSGAANARYSGIWYERFGNWDLAFESAILFPKSYRNFFGLGNETTIEDRGHKYYRAKLTRFEFEASIKTLVNQALGISIGNRLSITNVDENKDESNVLTRNDLGFDSGTFKDQWFNTLFLEVGISDIDFPANPTQGYLFSVAGNLNIGFHNTTKTFSRLTSELKMYFPIRFSPQITLANRTGGVHNIGSFPFYESNSIGGTTNLRGFRGNRFSGRSTAYNNTELRVELFDFYRYLLGGKVGISAFFDTGRVWRDGESSGKWHQGVGGGVWFNLFDSVLINSSVGHSVEGNSFELKAGFFF